MLDLSTLPIDTKLIWDAPELYGGYVTDSNHPKRVFYTAMVYDQEPKRSRTLIKFRNGHNMWMSHDSKYLRYPTEDELKNESWEMKKSIWDL